jgi:hypothetical protein
MRRSGWFAALLAVLAALIVGKPLAEAGPGAAVNLAEVRIDERLLAGNTYELPTLAVTNTGDQPGSYRVDVAYVHQQPEKRPPSDWFGFAPREFALAPGESQQVEVRLNLSSAADPGEYSAFIRAAAAPTQATVSVTVAAATKLSFEVRPANWLEAQRLRISRFIDGNEVLAYGAAAFSLAWGGLLVWRRLPVRVRLERK